MMRQASPRPPVVTSGECVLHSHSLEHDVGIVVPFECLLVLESCQRRGNCVEVLDEPTVVARQP
jgi:hypothetical protein